ncbi:MAG: hypothetical protein JXB48_07430 [Candidatus Latescibacteria bacterium]|nr:hypothetical protein [Candidatus Latescibacterota bacterium]
MQFTISNQSPLKGNIIIDGDLRLTLLLMSLGLHMDVPVSIIHPSSAGEVSKLKMFLQRNDIKISDMEKGFTIKGAGLRGDVVIDYDISDIVLHSIAAGAIFTANSVRIISGKTNRSVGVDTLLKLLSSLGVKTDCISTDNDDVVIRDVKYSVDGAIPVRSQWAFEALLTSSLAAKSPIILSYVSDMCSFSRKALTFLGFKQTTAGDDHDQEAELERRLAKATGEKISDVQRFEWIEKPAAPFIIPGDTTLAAASAGCAVITQRSDILIKGVLWDSERRGFFNALRRMKALCDQVYLDNSHIFETADIRVKWSQMTGIHFTPAQSHSMSHELLILASVAAFAVGESVICDVMESPVAGREAFKLLARGLEKIGVHVGDYTDGIVLSGGTELRGNRLDSGGRPDVALALAIAGVGAAGPSTIVNSTFDTYPVSRFLNLISNHKST